MHVKRLYRPTVREALAAAREAARARRAGAVDRARARARLARLDGAARRASDGRGRAAGAPERAAIADDRRAGVGGPAGRVRQRRHRSARRAPVRAWSPGSQRSASTRRLAGSRRRAADRRRVPRRSPIGAAPRDCRRARSRSRPPTPSTRATRSSSARPASGKTTTIAKIAAQERASGGRTLGLVAADGFRAGADRAAAQLRRGHRRAVPRGAHAPTSSNSALAASRQTALVDTAGRVARRRSRSRDLLRRARRTARTCARISCSPPTRRLRRRARISRSLRAAEAVARGHHQARREPIGDAAARRRARARPARVVSRPPASACPKISGARRPRVWPPRCCASPAMEDRTCH